MEKTLGSDGNETQWEFPNPSIVRTRLLKFHAPRTLNAKHFRKSWKRDVVSKGQI